MYPDSLKKLIESFKLLPGIGEKTAERFAFSIMNFEDYEIENLSTSIKNVKEKVHRCSTCNNYTEEEICNICNDKNRNNAILCVVEEPKNLYMLEKTGTYNGMYHVINNLISPLDGINPEDIGLEKLIFRIKNEKFNEVVIAVKPSIEGETTSLYIKKILDGMNVRVTRLASGIPIGADMEYVDSMTLERALRDRKEIE